MLVQAKQDIWSKPKSKKGAKVGICTGRSNVKAKGKVRVAKQFSRQKWLVFLARLPRVGIFFDAFVSVTYARHKISAATLRDHNVARNHRVEVE